MCGDIGHPRKCVRGAITASGEEFNPNIASAAVAIPLNMRLRAMDVMMRIGKGPCVKVRLNDKMNPRWIGVRGFDLSPKALELLTGKRNRNWKGKVELCLK